MSEPSLRTIYCFHAGEWQGKPRGIALADDGRVLANTLSNLERYLGEDLGVGRSTRWHDAYNRHFGVGKWKTVWLENPMKSEDFIRALRFNGAQGI